MDSINQNQQEENRKNLNGKQAAEKIKELAEKAATCFFCSALNRGKRLSTRPMSVQDVDEQGNIWFLISDDSETNAEISEDPDVQLLFQGSHHSDFLSIYGKATTSRDKEKIKKFWNPLFKTWFTEGEDDSRIVVVKVALQEGYYWDNKHGGMVAFAKQVAGAVMGKTLDDSVEGTLRR